MPATIGGIDPPASVCGVAGRTFLERFRRWAASRDTPDQVAVTNLRFFAGYAPAATMLVLANVSLSGLLDDPGGWSWRIGAVSAATAVLALIAMLPASRRRSNRLNDAKPERGAALIRRVLLVVGLLGVALFGWFVLIAYPMAPSSRLVLPLMAAATFTILLCLVALPQAAVLFLGIVLPAATVIWWIEGPRLAWPVAVPMGAAGLTLAYLLARMARSLRTLARSYAELATKAQESERLSRENARLAHTDALTGLPNRRYFFAQLDALSVERTESLSPFAVILLDLDGFKPINDTYGHAAGDQLLAGVGRRLAEVAEDDVLVARLGGDEFGVLLCDVRDEPGSIGQAICDVLHHAFDIDDARLSIGCSGGLAVFPKAGLTSRELLDRADYALYHGKSQARGTCTVFSAMHESCIRSDQIIEAALRTGNLEHELDLHFHPIIDLHSMKVVRVEALARWNSPILGNVPPDRFIPTAEALGMISGISLMLVRKALVHARVLPAGIGMSINLSANDITSMETVEAVLAEIRSSGFDTGRLTFEITETAVMRDFDAAIEAINRFRSLGITMALDDFGTGYSSLTHLRRLPIDHVKVDRSFVAAMAGDHQPMIAAIGGLCRALSLQCVVEGVESEAQLLSLRHYGYRFAQGFYFARPMPMADLLVWLSTSAYGRNDASPPMALIAG